MHFIVGRMEEDTFLAITPAGNHQLNTDKFLDFVLEAEKTDSPRWVFSSVEAFYPILLRAGIRIQRCHDLALTEGLLLAHEERETEPRNLVAAFARLQGIEPPVDSAWSDPAKQPTLFETVGSGLPEGVSTVDAAAAVLADQEKRIAATHHPDLFRVLVAAESASALAAAEMSADGLPWREDVHNRLLVSLLGAKVPAGHKPQRLIELAAEVSAVFGREVNPDNPTSVVRAFSREGIEIPSARARVLREVSHPAITPLLKYKELSRLNSANGWTWLHEWVHNGRFRPHYVVGGVVSGRWASRGGAALQIPRTLRVCAQADPGWKLVVADAAQLEPRVLAALAGDRELARVSTSVDLYDSLAETLFPAGQKPLLPPGDVRDNRGVAKIGMLSAMYGGTSGQAGAALALLRQKFPVSVSYVENAAQTGERGGRVRSRLGRTSPAPSEAWRALTGGSPESVATEGKARTASRNWGRFTRNFVVQASAADWASVLLATLRQRLPAPAHLVFFQHDEVLIHTPEELADEVCEILGAAVLDTTKLVFGPACPVRFPMEAAIVDCYADAK